MSESQAIFRSCRNYRIIFASGNKMFFFFCFESLKLEMMKDINAFTSATSL